MLVKKNTKIFETNWIGPSETSVVSMTKNDVSDEMYSVT